MKGLHEKKSRTLIKSLTWRALATTTGMIVVYLFTNQLGLSVTFAVVDGCIKFIEYYLHERIWNIVTYGKTLKFSLKKAIRTPPVLVKTNETAPMIIEKMISSDIGAVVVVDNQNKPLGIVTERDALERVTHTGNKPSKILANEIMSSPLILVDYDLPLQAMLNTMKKNGVRRLVVIQKGIIVGIITERRILEALI